jgi:hypothetical protein
MLEQHHHVCLGKSVNLHIVEHIAAGSQHEYIRRQLAAVWQPCHVLTLYRLGNAMRTDFKEGNNVSLTNASIADDGGSGCCCSPEYVNHTL